MLDIVEFLIDSFFCILSQMWRFKQERQQKVLELQKVEILLELQKIDLDELNLVKEKIYQVSESQPGPIPWIEAKKTIP